MHCLRCVLIIFILTTYTQTPRDMSFISDVSVHYLVMHRNVRNKRHNSWCLSVSC